MVGFNSNDGIGSFGLGRTLFALSPAPASRDHQSGFVRKNYFSWLWMLYFGLTQRCIASAVSLALVLKQIFADGAC